MDVTVVRAFLGNEFYVASVFDAFSRCPLAVQCFLGSLEHRRWPGS
jgi:hypothetical protein